MINTRWVCFGLFAVLVLSALVAGCQDQLVRHPSILDRQILGPFAVHLAYTDGQKIFGRSAPTVVELAEAPTVLLLEPSGSVEGLSMTFFRNRRYVAWLDGAGLVHAGALPGPMSSTVIVDTRAFETRPGITATADRLYLTASERNVVKIFSSADGQAWEPDGNVILAFDAGATDVVHADGLLWIAVTTKDRNGTDSATLVRVRLNSLGQTIASDPEYFPVVGLPPAIDGARRVRVASNGSIFAVGGVSRPFQFPIAGESVRETYFAVSDPGDEFHVSWSRGSESDGRGELRCPVALVFVPRAGDSSGQPSGLGRVLPHGSDPQQQTFVAMEDGEPYYSGQSHTFDQFTPVQIKDAALAAGRELVTVRLEIRDDFRP